MGQNTRTFGIEITIAASTASQITKITAPNGRGDIIGVEVVVASNTPASYIGATYLLQANSEPLIDTQDFTADSPLYAAQGRRVTPCHVKDGGLFQLIATQPNAATFIVNVNLHFAK